MLLVRTSKTDPGGRAPCYFSGATPVSLVKAGLWPRRGSPRVGLAGWVRKYETVGGTLDLRQVPRIYAEPGTTTDRHLPAQAYVRREAAEAVMQQADRIQREDAIFDDSPAESPDTTPGGGP